MIEITSFGFLSCALLKDGISLSLEEPELFSFPVNENAVMDCD
jgi:hypothetical protein